MRKSRRAVFWALSASALLTSPAWGQTEDKAAATLLYDDASKLMAAGKAEQACSKFGESQRLDPQLGTLLHLADCLQKIGRTASAWANFREAADMAARRSDTREKVARTRAASLEPTLSKLLIDVAPSAKSSALKVERDGVVVGSALWGTAVPVDPGTHAVTASSEGKKAWSGTVTVAAGAQTASITVPELEAEGATPQPAAIVPVTTPSATTEATTVSLGSSGNAARTAAFIAGGAGVVGIGLGVVFMLKSSSARQQATDLCGGDTENCVGLAKKPQVDDLDHEANRDKVIGVTGLAIGGAALATGVVLYFTSKKPAPTEAFVRPTVVPGGVGVVGRF
jgi:hypothetical protein